MHESESLVDVAGDVIAAAIVFLVPFFLLLVELLCS